MTERLNYAKAFPEGVHLLVEMERALKASGLEASLMELVKMRASQMNGCAYCLDMHSKDARAAGETEQRLYVLPAWRETDGDGELVAARRPFQTFDGFAKPRRCGLAR